MPAFDPHETFHAILSFYSLTPEGDSLVSDETLEGLGTSRSLLYVLFGSIIRLFSPRDSEMRATTGISTTPGDASGMPGPQSPTSTAEAILQPGSDEAHPRSIGGTLHSGADPSDARASAMSALSHGSPALSPGRLHAPAAHGEATEPAEDHAAGDAVLDPTPEKTLWKLTDFVPDPGYFLAGAIAGGVSRTATAPLDRLKVYLLVNTSATRTTRDVAGAVKGGNVVGALKLVGNPFSAAVRDLWAAGGARTFFAGEYAAVRWVGVFGGIASDGRR